MLSFFVVFVHFFGIIKISFKYSFKIVKLIFMNGISCIKEIEQRYEKLTFNEKKVSNYIVANPETVINLSISELAEITEVSKSAVVRLAKSLGFDGFPELKISLAKDISDIDSTYSSYIYKEDDSALILKKVFNANIKTLKSTLRLLDLHIFDLLVKSISSCNMLYINGIGASGDLARDLQRRMMQIGILAVSYTDSAAQMQSSLNTKKGDIVLGISQSGRTVSVVDSLRLAKEKGVITACITGYSDSPIVQYADFPIVITTNSLRYPIDSISARVSQNSVCDSLIVALSNLKYSAEETKERIQKSNSFVEELRYVK